MKIEWEIDYTYKTAECNQLVVSLNEHGDGDIGFIKYESGKTYTAKILYMTKELHDLSTKNHNILPQYMSQLGDAFNEFEWNDARIKDIETFLGKKPTDADLARYLDVTRSAVSQYDSKKKELMKLGLWLNR